MKRPLFGLTATLWLVGSVSCSGARLHRIEEIAYYNTAGWAHDVTLDGSLAYVSDRQGGFLIFDRTLGNAGWAAPRIAAPVQDVISLAPHGGRPVLAARFEGLVLVDEAGAQLSRYANGDIANAAVTRGDMVYAAYGAHGLVTARAVGESLEWLAELPTPGWSHDVKLWGDRALLADWDYGLRVVDIRTPEHPVEIGVLPGPATAISISLGESQGEPMAALAEGHGGVAIVRFDSAGRPALVSRHAMGLHPADAPHPESGGWAHSVAWCGNYVFVADWKRGLAVLDVRDPRTPRLALEAPTRGTSLGVKAETQPDGTILVFLADGEEGLRVFRFSS